MDLTRHAELYVIMTVIYQELSDFGYLQKKDNTLSSRNFKTLAADLLDCEEKEVPVFVENTIAYSLSKYGEIVAAYVPFLKKWTWDRLPMLTQAILLMSYSHYFFVEKVHKSIVISTAVDFAKRYVDEAQAKFINAILDKVLK